MTTIEFTDTESQDAACVIVRRCHDSVAISISLRADGDIETFLDRANAEQLVAALQRAVAELPPTL